jgi:hypothetical protein
MDLSGEVNALDYARINQGFLSQNTPQPLGGYQNGDLDFSAAINALDYALINGAFLGQHQFQPSGTAAAGRTADAPAAAAKVIAPAAGRRQAAPKQRSRRVRRLVLNDER